MAASTASACLRRLSPFVYSHNNSQASARSGMSGFCSTGESYRQADHEKAQMPDHKEHKTISCFCALCGLSGVRREIPGARANRNVLARRRHLDVAIVVVALFLERIVTEHVLSAELGCDLRERIGQ